MSAARSSWKEHLKDLLAMGRAERNGFAILLVFCLGLLASTWYERTRVSDPVQDLAELEAAWAPLEARTKELGDRPEGSGSQRLDVRLILSDFDPNQLPLARWMELGLTEKQAGAIHRYEERGGRFRTKGDLARMRVVDPELFLQWEPYIQLPVERPERKEREPVRGERPRTAPFERSTVEVKREAPRAVELNSADSVALVEVRGIGPSFARGILRYRERLGGFHHLDQLAEVHVLRDKPEAVERIKALLVVDPGLVRTINVNTMTAEDLGGHPYASWKLAKALVAYRKNHGPFEQVRSIQGCLLVTDSVYERLAPYLTVE